MMSYNIGAIPVATMLPGLHKGRVNLQRLEILQAVVRNHFNVSRAAQELRQSQPGLSRQLAVLETEVGAPLFLRRGKRLVSLSGPGEEVYRVASRILRDAESLRTVAAGYRESERGSLVIATTHTQARYALPKVIQRFRQVYPEVRLVLHQGSPTEVCEEVLEGTADIAIATEALSEYPELVVLPVYEWNRSIIAPPDHPILRADPLTLAEVARYPIVTYAFAFSGRSQINAAFVAQGLSPQVVLSAIDADIIKTYVELGLGIGIVASMAYSQETDVRLGARDASHLFPMSQTGVALRRGVYLKGYTYGLIELIGPHLTRAEVDEALQLG
jgi:LysR family transcriptional regulator, cys regulon transcriptional activator